MSTMSLEALAPFDLPVPERRLDVFSPQEIIKSIRPAKKQSASPALPEVSIRPEATDSELMQAISFGSERALEMLHERYHRLAFSLAYRILQDAATAEDIVQEAFLSLWRKASSYQSQHGSVSTWLQSIVHHRAIDHVRSSAYRNEQWATLQTEHEQDTASSEPDALEYAWQNEQQRLIRVALAQMPPEQRQVIELAYFGGYTHVEIAEKCHIPLGTVKGRMRLGLQKMKVFLQERGLAEI